MHAPETIVMKPIPYRRRTYRRSSLSFRNRTPARRLVRPCTELRWGPGSTKDGTTQLPARIGSRGYWIKKHRQCPRASDVQRSGMMAARLARLHTGSIDGSIDVRK